LNKVLVGTRKKRGGGLTPPHPPTGGKPPGPRGKGANWTDPGDTGTLHCIILIKQCRQSDPNVDEPRVTLMRTDPSGLIVANTLITLITLMGVITLPE